MILPTDSMESIRPLSNDDRRAAWAARYYALGLHRSDYVPPIETDEAKETEQ